MLSLLEGDAYALTQKGGGSLELFHEENKVPELHFAATHCPLPAAAWQFSVSTVVDFSSFLGSPRNAIVTQMQATLIAHINNYIFSYIYIYTHTHSYN